MYAMRKARSAPAFDSPSYYDTRYQAEMMKVLAGEYIVTGEDVILTTLLGSCVSACIRDPLLRIGGMNHFMLPDLESGGVASESARYGDYAMEVLINELLKRGARRERLEAKVFGGGNVLPSFSASRVGERNAQFVLEYLKLEGIAAVAQDLRDVCPRQVNYYPQSGRAMVRRLPRFERSLVAADETRYLTRLRKEPAAGSVELFGDTA